MSQPTPTQDHSSPDPTRSWLATPQVPPSPPSQPTSSATGQPAPLPPSTNSATPTAAPPSQTRPPSLTDVVQTIKPSDFLKVHQSPCSQQGFLTGIGSGATIGLLRWVMGLPAPKAANWAVGVGALGALFQYEYCQYKRREEREKMLRMVEVFNTRQAKEKAEAEERLAQQQRREREGREQGEASKKAWWRVW